MTPSLRNETEEQALIASEEKFALLGRAPSSSNTTVPLGIETFSPQLLVEAKQADALKLLWGVGGIYVSFLYYGSLQEDVFLYESSNGDGSKFKQAWFLQVLESLANVIIGFLGRKFVGGTADIPQKMFFISGVTQVCAKACTSLSLANGLSFPVATLAKSGKMAPVMLGQLCLGGARYSLREYLQVVAIIGGTALVRCVLICFTSVMLLIIMKTPSTMFRLFKFSYQILRILSRFSLFPSF